MQKVLLSLGLLAGISFAAQAQTGVRFGLKAGASLTNVTSTSQDNKFGFHGGGLVNLGINDMFSIQPEILYSNKGYKVKGGANDLRVALNYIDVPVLVKVATGSTGLFFELGPQVGFRIAADIKDNDNSSNFKDYTKSVDFGYAAGLGFQLESGPMVGLRYNGGFTNIGKSGTINGVQVTATDAKNSAFQLYVGYVFGGK
ncbi:MAG: porin family protein [Janthinobacterium lividum]